MKLPVGSVKKRGTRYRARITWTDRKSGKRTQKSRLVPSAKAARDLIRDWRNHLNDTGQIPSDGTPHRSTGPTWRDAANLFIRDHATPPVWSNGEIVSGMRSWRTARQRANTVAEVAGEGTPLADTTPALLSRLRTALLGRKVWRRSRKTGKLYETDAPLSPATVNRLMATASVILSAAVDEGWLTVNPFPRTRKARGKLITTAQEKPRQRILSQAEELRLLTACDAPQKYRKGKDGGNRAGRKGQADSAPRAHLRPILVCLIDTGMRWGELKRLRWKDVDEAEGLIRIEATHTKTLRARVVGITERLAVELAKLRREQRVTPEALVFGIRSNIENSWNTVRKLAGLTDVRLHDLRHTAATRMIARGFAAPLVGRILGHSVVATTYRYTNTDDEIAKQAAKLLDGMEGSVN